MSKAGTQLRKRRIIPDGKQAKTHTLSINLADSMRREIGRHAVANERSIGAEIRARLATTLQAE